MLNRIIQFSIQNKLIIALGIFALIIVGVYQATKLPIDAVPDITNNQVLIISNAPAYSATDIERLITSPIELANSNIAGLKEIRSFSRFGLSLVTIVFNDNIDLYWARQQVTERLQKIQIPKEICIPELGPITTGLGEIYQYVLRAKEGYETKFSHADLRTLQDWFVKRELLMVKGVAEVNSLGGDVKQYEVALYTNKLKEHGLTMTDVFTALEQNNQNAGGAYIEKQASALFIVTDALLQSLEDIKNIVVKKRPNGVPLFIRDIADVHYGRAIRYGAMCYNDQGEVCGGIVMMLKGANSNEVIKNIKTKITQIQKGLPEGVVLEAFLDRSKMVHNAISTVENNLIEGALIVVFVLVFFLGNIRASLLVASIIPLAMLFAIMMMNLFGVSGNLMSLGALDFGLIIDGAVIIVEAVLHGLTQHQKTKNIFHLHQQDRNTLVGATSQKMMNSAVFGQVIILVVYLPIFMLEGIEGKMFQPMVQTVAFALLGAFILSLTYIPMMSALLLNVPSKNNFSDKIMDNINKKYVHLLAFVLRIPKTILACVSILFCVCVFLLTQLGGEFIPALEEGDLAIDTRILTGSNLNASVDYTQKAAHSLLQHFPEIEKIVTKIGSGEVPTDPMPMEAADMMIILSDKNKWTSATTFPELTEKMSAVLETVPGINVGFQYPVQMRFNELMTGTKQDVSCKIFGDNLDSLVATAKTLSEIVNNIDGAKDVYVEPIGGMPQIVITYNRKTMAQYHINVNDINTVITSAFAGKTAGFVYEGERKFELVVRLAQTQKKNIEDIKNILIPTNQNIQIPLWQLANVELKNGVNQIQREATKRRIVVAFNVRNRDVESLVEKLQQKVTQQLKLPLGYRIQYGGSFENLKEAKTGLSIAVPIALVVIFLLLYFTFRSLSQALLIYTAIPLSAMGGILFLYWRALPFSISAGVGFIALFGVAVLNGIVLVTEFNTLKKNVQGKLFDLVIEGGRNRLRPVLMTAFVAALGFLPMALSKGAGAEVQRPLATVVIGGLFIATFLTLFVLPILYVLTEQKKNHLNDAKEE